MSDFLDAGSVRVAGYLVVAGVALVLWWSEQRHPARVEREWWPTYWWTSAALLLSMAAARAGSLGDLVGELGREQVRSGGWYDARRTLQAVSVIAVSALWGLGVIIAVWRVPPRRRRYLPHAVGVSGLVAFAAIRIVSLHQVDALLYRRDIAGVRIVSILELTLLAVTAVAGIVTTRPTPG